MRPFARFLILALLCATLSACGGGKKDETVFKDKELPVETLYNQAADQLDTGKYKEAAKGFDEVDRQYPYSEWANRAQLMAAYSHYKNMNYDSAIVSLDRFIQLHPGNEDIDYAYYLKALSYYEQITDVRRDQAMTKDAMEALDAILERFPNSRYARDAQLKKDLTLDHLAGKEMDVGRYYEKQGIYPAALKRFQNVVKKYQTTTHAPEALFRIVEINVALGLDSEASRVAAILGYNYPGSDWYKDAYGLLKPEYKAQLDADKDRKGLVGRTLDSLF
jgi:outer membrane protein assembly factor BamD